MYHETSLSHGFRTKANLNNREYSDSNAALARRAESWVPNTSVTSGIFCFKASAMLLPPVFWIWINRTFSSLDMSMISVQISGSSGMSFHTSWSMFRNMQRMVPLMLSFLYDSLPDYTVAGRWAIT